MPEKPSRSYKHQRTESSSIFDIKELFRLHEKLIYYHLNTHKIPNEDKQDIYGQIVYKVIKGYDKIRNKDNFKAWLNSITSSTISDYYRDFIRDRKLLRKFHGHTSGSLANFIPTGRLTGNERKVFESQLKDILIRQLNALDAEIREPFSETFP